MELAHSFTTTANAYFDEADVQKLKDKLEEEEVRIRL